MSYILFFFFLLSNSLQYCASSTTSTTAESGQEKSSLGKRRTASEDEARDVIFPVEALSEQAQRWAKELQQLKKLEKAGVELPLQVTLYGQHGIGKTWAVQQVAKSLNAPCYAESSQTIMCRFEALEDKLARYNTWVTDEYDTLVRQAQGRSSKFAFLVVSSFRQIMNMQGFCINNAMQHVKGLRVRTLKHTGIHLVFCAEYGSEADLQESAYFDAQIKIDRPTQSERRSYIEWILSTMLCDKQEIDSNRIAYQTEGLALVQINQLLQQAAREAVCDNKQLTTELISGHTSAKRSRVQQDSLLYS